MYVYIYILLVQNQEARAIVGATALTAVGRTVTLPPTYTLSHSLALSLSHTHTPVCLREPETLTLNGGAHGCGPHGPQSAGPQPWLNTNHSTKH